MSTTCYQIVTIRYHSVTGASNFHFQAAASKRLRLRIPELRRALSNFLKQLRSYKQLANCTKNPCASCKNFVILPYVKTIDKFKNLCYNIYRK